SQRVAGKEGRQMRLHADRAHARAAAAMRNTERLVQVQVRYVGAVVAGSRESDLRIEIRTVDVDLAAGAVHDVAQPPDAFLEYSVRRRVGGHDGGQSIR